MPSRAARAEWTVAGALPGGDFPGAGFDVLVNEIASGRPWLERRTAARLARAYGINNALIIAFDTCAYVSAFVATY